MPSWQDTCLDWAPLFLSYFVKASTFKNFLIMWYLLAFETFLTSFLAAPEPSIHDDIRGSTVPGTRKHCQQDEVRGTGEARS